MPRALIDLTGRKFDRLTVLNRAENAKNGARQWLCRCSCGRTEVFSTQVLLSKIESEKMCRVCRKKSYDLSGQRFGKYLIIRPTAKVRASNDRRYVCRCEQCGTEREIQLSYLKSGGDYCPVCDINNLYHTTGTVAFGTFEHSDTKARFIIDIDDLEAVKQHHWFPGGDKGSQAFTRLQDGTQMSLAHFIFQLHNVYDDSKMTMFLNKNCLDCRKENITQVTRAEQAHYRRTSKNNTSGRTGVNWNKQLNRWIARIGIDSHTVHLGAFVTYEEAVRAREEAEKRYYDLVYTGE